MGVGVGAGIGAGVGAGALVGNAGSVRAGNVGAGVVSGSDTHPEMPIVAIAPAIARDLRKRRLPIFMTSPVFTTSSVFIVSIAYPLSSDIRICSM